jgi:hypothetical protein
VGYCWAGSLERDAARKHIEIVCALSQVESVLKKIDELRTFRAWQPHGLAIYLDC